MELFGVVLGLSVLSLVVLALALSLALPLLWLWMLVDAVIREAHAYPSQDNVEKIVWIVLMLIFQPVAVVYFFMVWRTQERVRLHADRSEPVVVATA
jgi:hypothetical protein